MVYRVFPKFTPHLQANWNKIWNFENTLENYIQIQNYTRKQNGASFFALHFNWYFCSMRCFKRIYPQISTFYLKIHNKLNFSRNSKSKWIKIGIHHLWYFCCTFVDYFENNLWNIYFSMNYGSCNSAFSQNLHIIKHDFLAKLWLLLSLKISKIAKIFFYENIGFNQ